MAKEIRSVRLANGEVALKISRKVVTDYVHIARARIYDVRDLARGRVTRKNFQQRLDERCTYIAHVLYLRYVLTERKALCKRRVNGGFFVDKWNFVVEK